MLVGVLLFINNARAYAGDKVGLTYGAKATLQSNYLWRGLYSGGPAMQMDANVGYGGLYASMWWNIGATDWGFSAFQPEVDLSIGFARWGLNAYVLYIHNFNCGFFDFANYADKGNRLEVNVQYTISEKIPLRFHWGTRVSASDGYLDASGHVKRAYSSYAEISYTQALPYDMSLYGAIGVTPWKSCYSRYQRGAEIANIEVRLRKDWSISEHCGLMLTGQLTCNPFALAADKTTAEWHPTHPSRQAINANLSVGVYLK